MSEKNNIKNHGWIMQDHAGSCIHILLASTTTRN